MSRKNPPILLGVHAAPSRRLRYILAGIPFVLLFVVYILASEVRHQNNPNDKLLPTISKMASAIDRMAFTKDRRSDTYLMPKDTISSLKRLAVGVFLAATIGLLIGLNIAVYPGLSALFRSTLTFFSMIPPLAVLPILFIIVGIDEMAKIVLIIIGVFPIIARDTYLAAKKLPAEQVTKALTLGASQLAIAYRIVLPQIVPRLIDSVRLSLGAAWLFLIAAEAIAATDGLGYRIFLVRRYLSMDIIIPYVLWITLLGFAFDYVLRAIVRRLFPWYNPAGNDS